MIVNVQPLMSKSADLDEAAEGGAREWFTAAELAELALPGLPTDKRSLNRRARDENWHLKVDSQGEPLSRPRIGRGGGTEFNLALLPPSAQLELAKRGIAPRLAEEALAAPASSSGWRWYEGQSAKVKAEAERRMRVVTDIDAMEAAGMTRTAAISAASSQHDIASSTLWNWLRLVEGVAACDRLPALAPRRQGGGREAEIDPLLWHVFKSDYLRLSAPTLTSCYDRTRSVADEKGLSMPSEKSFRRRLEREVDPRVILLRRKGEEAFRRSLPSQRRDTECLHALECVNIDGHKFDVFVRHPEKGVIRPLMVAIQDVYSSKILAWRVCETESAAMARLTFADLFRNYGIPAHCVLDNGRGFASKWLTGQAKTRFRFKIKEEEPTGVLVALQIKIHWAMPYRGQSKPIERAFRDLCDRIAKHPLMEGAYTGNTPMAKPENYGSRAVDWDVFVAHVAEGIAAHNSRLGRRGRGYAKRSFDEVFAASYATAPIRKTATPEQLRMALLAAEQKRVNRRTGEIELFGNRYWSMGCGQLHGRKVTVRFDPDNLHQEVYLYGEDGRYLTSAQLMADTGFLDAQGAKDAAKRLADARRLVRSAADAEQLLSAAEVARLLPGTPTFEVPEPRVVRPVRPNIRNGAQNAALKAAPAEDAIEDEIVAALGAVNLRLVE